MRQHDGRPSPGMQPRVTDPDGEQVLAAMTVLILPDPPQDRLAEIRHIVRSTGDPNIRREKAVKLMSGAYFQNTTDFNERITALFPKNAQVAANLQNLKQCRLQFDQFSQKFELLCNIKNLPSKADHYQFTWWHNTLFNPQLQADVTVLEFRSDWSNSTANPIVS